MIKGWIPSGSRNCQPWEEEAVIVDQGMDSQSRTMAFHPWEEKA
jgi:hypothetical protein